jgi:hypothetical protein
MALNNNRIKERLIEKFGEQVSNFEEPYGMLTFEAPKDMNLKLMQFLFDDDELKFRFSQRFARYITRIKKEESWLSSITCTT